MVVKEVNEKYKCNICGNEVIVTNVGGGSLVCCGEEMELIEPRDKKSLLEEGLEIDDEDEEKSEDEEEEPKEIEDYEEDIEEEEDSEKQ